MTDTTNATDTPNANAGSGTPSDAPAPTALGGQAPAQKTEGQDGGAATTTVDPSKSGEPTGEAKTDGAGTPSDKEGEDSKAKAGAPETYEDFKLPENVLADSTAMDEFKAEAKGLNLTQEQAQNLVNRGADLVQKTVQQVYEQQVAQYAEKVKGWNEARAKDPEIGGTEDVQQRIVGDAVKVVNAIWGSSDPEKNPLIKALNETGAGNHPEIIRAFYRLRELVGNDGKLITGMNPSGQVLTEAQKLYPGLPSANA